MSVPSFSQYLVEEERSVYFTFGRMNPPTIGHEKLLNSLASKAGRNPYRVYLSQSQDKSKNPLKYMDKIKIARKMFPKHARQILINKKVKSAMDVAVVLYNEGFKQLVMVVGSDRIREFDILLKKYNGSKARHGFYNFEKITVISAGERDPDAEGVSGMSASKMRAAAKANDFTSFGQGLPRAISNSDAKKLFNSIRTGMNIKEEASFKNHVELASVSKEREAFVAGELFNEGDEVIIKKTDEVGTITILGANYVIVETADRKTRQWLDSVEKIVEEAKYDYGTDASVKQIKKITPGQNEKKNAEDPDIGDRKGSQPVNYHKGLKKSTKVARDAHFKKNAKKADDDNSAYTPAPGDKTAKTKPSKYTKRFKAMFGEDAVAVAKIKIDKEKESDAIKHDKMMDRARLRKSNNKNRQTKGTTNAKI